MPSDDLLIRLLLEKHSDVRGMLVQNDYPELFDDIKHFLLSYSEPGVIRGNHYHKRKKEWFLVIQGTMELHLLDRATQIHEKYILSSDTPELVVMEPNIVHAFKNIGTDTLIFLGLVNEPFDVQSPDTYQETILE